ncbi:hypothetical protein A1F94_003220 [Pyrenophora tritici-repentis]|uniref:Uncharacterized protein n=1 Tax=Pyrenophora tritici-repentis TaxID=45151 RepID=A0A5M9LKM6_9PLEO|nr:hypothetical protein PtrV1_04433 [Pyrenophora tritici-repentis]KAF7452124.1 hypothetical protein A1F99_039010 [Pyrenophora tritici-repentis]KAF7574760.1 hypothetical protein PtrM4_063840 [Pyrenophora tritici-repentis]KAG9386470.1 hypothetical protein A1F94_003220 [Pyrenophora tritici-repentis]KAI0588075.1 hypothetical protein Alg130_03543 [Pyrenophora tritici-repentis]
MTILSTVPVPEALDLAAGITLAHANKACTGGSELIAREEKAMQAI